MAENLVTSSNGIAPLLPPCRVCGEKASGFHYGANTCEACKGFFRRSLARKADYMCAALENCEIQPGRRSICAFCRYQKCLAVGMSKEAIKTGRYTHEKKTRDIEEVKRIQRREAVQNSKRGVKSPEEREAELEKIIKHITAAHLQQTPHSPDFFQKLPEREAKYLEKRALQERMFGTMKPIPREEYQQIYQSTGIDIDGRREMISQMIPCIEKAIKRFIAFAKALPGFKDLAIEDQIALIKAGRFETWLLAQHRAVNVEQRLFTVICGKTLHQDDMKMINDDIFIEEFFRGCSILKRLHLQVPEIGLLQGIVILSADKVEVSNPEKVEEYQMTLVEALKYWLNKTRPDDPHMFPRCITALAELRQVARCQKRSEEVLENLAGLDVPPLLLEMWSS